jgi:hypothetical protein
MLQVGIQRPGTNQTVTNLNAINIPGGPIAPFGGGVATNSYGLKVNAYSGATNNYAAVFTGGNVGIGVTSPTVQFERACPAGFTNVKSGNNQLGCISTNLEAAGNVTFQQAADSCFDNYGGRLLTHSEWTSAYQNFAFTNENSLIWLGDIASTTEGYVWNGPLSLSANTFTVPAGFRCIIPK